MKKNLTEGLTPEEIEELESRVTTKLKSMKELSDNSQDLDEMLASKGDLMAHKDDDSELTASDADIRGRLYEITGEDGVMPGDEVNIGMGLSDSSIAGNEIEEVSSDFTVEDDDQPLTRIRRKRRITTTRQKPKHVNRLRKPLNVVPVALKYRLWQSNAQYVGQNSSDVRRLS